MASAFETEMGVLPEIAKAVDEMEWSLPTDIQSDAIPLILGGGDVLMAAETGSGKTGAFCLPVLQIVYESLKNCNGKKKTVANSFWKMNAYDRTISMAIDADGTLCQSRDQGGWHGCRANKAIKGPGKYYFEALVTDDGLCRVGWSTSSASLELGTCPFGFGFGGTGKKSNNKKFDSYGESFANGDKIGNCIDFERNEIRWYKNNVDLGVAYKIPASMLREEFYPSVCLKNAEMRFNFGRTRVNDVPKGFTVLQEAPNNCVVVSNRGPEATNGSWKATKKGPLAIIIEPSRELAEQTFKQLQLFNKYLIDPQPMVSLIVGGSNVRDQQNQMASGVDIVVATPGRLQDVIAGRVLSLDNCRFFILDECDGLLNQGHKALIEEIHAVLPKIGPTGDRLQMIVCSATLHSFDVKKLANSLMHFPQWVDLKGEDSVPDTVHHVVCLVDPSCDKSWKNRLGGGSNSIGSLTDRVHYEDQLNVSVESPEMMSEAVKIIKMKYVLDVIEKLNIDRALIFCRTKLDCDNLEKLFITRGGGPSSNTNSKHQFSCVCLHSDRRPDERKNNLNRFKEEKVRFMICTDVAARGIDIKGLPYVINVTLPDEKENYVHRIGRVGRAERMGLAISLVSNVKEKVWYHANCGSRGKNCYNTNLVEQKGCCIWYNEKKLLTDIEEHLGVTIDQIGNDFKIQINEFDGKVVYGEKLKKIHTVNSGHVDILAPTVRELAALEKECQQNYLNLLFQNVAVL